MTDDGGFFWGARGAMSDAFKRLFMQGGAPAIQEVGPFGFSISVLSTTPHGACLEINVTDKKATRCGCYSGATST